MLSEGSWRDLVELDAGIDGLDAVACLDACWPVLLELAAVWVVGLEDVLATFPLSAGLLLKRKVFRFSLLIYNFLERLRLMNAITMAFAIISLCNGQLKFILLCEEIFENFL